MKKIFLYLVLAICSTTLFAQVQLASTPWTFPSNSQANSTLTNQHSQADFFAPCDSSFTIKFTIDLKKFDKETTILEIPWVLKVKLLQHNPEDRGNQNYPAYKMPDGSVPVLEARIFLKLPIENQAVREMPIGIPLAILNNPEGKHDIVLNFSGVRWTMYVDGELLDNDFPLGYPLLDKQTSWKINPEYVNLAEIYCPGIVPQSVAPNQPRTTPEIQYWTPEGHNTWIGDVATFYHNGRYHVFYLYDRRGHSSKFGRGAHYFEHLSTSDFKTWIEHKTAVPLEHQWETFGTGTPFVFNDKLCLSYGLHTTRIYPAHQTTLPMLWDFYKDKGFTGSFNYDTIPLFPAGSSYAISEDGVSNFKKTDILFHPCENPSVYTDPEGRLRMLANYGATGTWESDSINGGWHSINPGFPPGGDCTFFFHWGNFDYIIGGFGGFWSKPATFPDDKYQDVVKQGLDFYNGMSVPAITEISDGRFLMAGWLKLVNWGGTLHIHELVQLPNGWIGSKWMEEITPQTERFQTIEKKLTNSTPYPCANESFMLTFEVHPKKMQQGKLGVVFLPEKGDSNACELQLNLIEKRAQFGSGSLSGFAPEEKSLRQGGHPHGAHNYAIENLMDVDTPFTVRVIVKNSKKWDGSIIDTEISQKRTMLTFRPDLKVKNILFHPENMEIRNIRIAPLAH